MTTDLSGIKTDTNTFNLREIDDMGNYIVQPRRGDTLEIAKENCIPKRYRFKCVKKAKQEVDDITDPGQGSDYDVVSTGFNINIYRKDIRRLRDKERLNDVIICFFLLMMQAKYDKVHVFNTVFMKKLCDGWEGHNPKKKKFPVKFVYENVSTWTRKVNVLQNKWILIPVHVKSILHWVGVAVNIYDKVVYFLDSLGPCLGQSDYVEATQHWIEKEMTSRTEMKTMDESFWDEWELREVHAEQQNSYDCRVFVCMNFWCLVNNVPLTHTRQDNILSFRQLMTLSILRNKIQPAL